MSYLTKKANLTAILYISTIIFIITSLLVVLQTEEYGVVNNISISELKIKQANLLDQMSEGDKIKNAKIQDAKLLAEQSAAIVFLDDAPVSTKVVYSGSNNSNNNTNTNTKPKPKSNTS